MRNDGARRLRALEAVATATTALERAIEERRTKETQLGKAIVVTKNNFLKLQEELKKFDARIRALEACASMTSMIVPAPPQPPRF